MERQVLNWIYPIEEGGCVETDVASAVTAAAATVTMMDPGNDDDDSEVVLGKFIPLSTLLFHFKYTGKSSSRQLSCSSR